LTEQEVPLRSAIARAKTVLVHNMDAGLASLMAVGRSATYLVLFRHAAHVQRQAQSLWSRWTKEGRSAGLSAVRLYPAETHLEQAYRGQYDLLYDGLPFSQYNLPEEIALALSRFANALAPGGLGFLLGPPLSEGRFRERGLRVAGQWNVTDLPPFHMHQTILIKARIKAGLTLYLLGKS
jgi:hypothetical protein